MMSQSTRAGVHRVDDERLEQEVRRGVAEAGWHARPISHAPRGARERGGRGGGGPSERTGLPDSAVDAFIASPTEGIGELQEGAAANGGTPHALSARACYRAASSR